MGVDLRELCFGVEVEMVGGRREDIGRAVREHLRSLNPDYAEGVGMSRRDSGSVTVCREYHDGNGYRAEEWWIRRDGSLREDDGSDGGSELITPVLRYTDLPVLLGVVRAVRNAGNHVNASCGLHVHVDAGLFDGCALRRLAYLVYAHEEFLYRALAVSSHRRERYAKPFPVYAIHEMMDKGRTLHRNTVGQCWYGTETDEDSEVRGEGRIRYHDTRYHGLNLHAVWNHGTVEFRYFEGTLHTGKIEAYVTLALAMCAYALNTRRVIPRVREYHEESAKYDFRTILLRFGLIGDEFKTARRHLLAHLPGNAERKC